MTNYVKLLELESHVEGGYFKLFYKSSDKVKPLSERYHQEPSQTDAQTEKSIERHAGSSIYFLLEKQGFSAWHRLKSDEVWHYYDGGSPIDMHVIGHDGQLKTYALGNPSITENASFQIAVKAGVWFAAEVRDKESFGLVGCTVSPAFEYGDFELAEGQRDQIVQQYPELANIIDKFIKPRTVETHESTLDHTASFVENTLSAKDYIQKLKLERHVEGGYFGVNYVATDVVIPLDPRYKTKEEKETSGDMHRKAGSSIYFLLENHDFSAWHQLKSDEIWHYYNGGSPIDIHVINQDGHLKTFTLGNPAVTEGASFQVAIRAGSWFAAEVRDKASFGLVGCSVSPGFEYGDFVLADRKHLSSQYPAHESIIHRLTRVAPVSSKSWIPG